MAFQFTWAGLCIAGAHHKCAMRNPITIAHMLALVLALDFNIPFHCAIWVVACNALWGCSRLGELTIPTKARFDPKHYVARNTTVTFSDNPDNTPKLVNFCIPWTKTTEEIGASVTGVAQHDELEILCPFAAMKRHLQANPVEFSLFGYIDDSSTP